MEIVKKLMLHVDKAEGTTYRDELLTKIIDICSQSNYQYITNFEWSVTPHQHCLYISLHILLTFVSFSSLMTLTAALNICLTGTSVSWWS